MEKVKVRCQITKKVRYDTIGEAQKILLNLKTTTRFYTNLGKRVNRRAKKANQVRIYKCPDCAGYHMTSSETKITKKTKLATKEFNKKRLHSVVLNQEQAEDWKKDSLPFPINEIKNEMV